MFENLLPNGAILSGLVGAMAIFAARQIAPVGRVLDKAPPSNGGELPIPHLMISGNGFPLGYVVAPVALAIAVHKFM